MPDVARLLSRKDVARFLSRNFSEARNRSSNILGISEFRTSEARSRGFLHFPMSRDKFVRLLTGSAKNSEVKPIQKLSCADGLTCPKTSGSVFRTNDGGAAIHNMMKPTEGSANFGKLSEEPKRTFCRLRWDFGMSRR